MSIAPKLAATALVALILGITPAWAEMARGEGANLDQAVRSALRRAVEQSVGVQVVATTAVDRFEVVRNEIVSHAEGFVSRYRLVRQGVTEGGVTFAEIDAEVEAGRVRETADAIPGLLAMAGNPRVAVLGIDGGFDAVSAVLPEAVALREAAGDILRDRFRFSIIDSRSLSRRGSAQRRQDALDLARSAKADYAILVSLTGRDLSLEAVKLANNQVVGRDIATGERAGYLAMGDRVFPLTVSLAHQIATDLQQMAGSGDGFRYSVILAEFPPEMVTETEHALSRLPGFVRMEKSARDRGRIEYSLWSLQPTTEFDTALKKMLADANRPTRVDLRGLSFRVEYLDPVFR